MNKKRIGVIGIIILVLLGSIVGGSLYMIDYSLRPVNRGKDMEGSMQYMKQT